MRSGPPAPAEPPADWRAAYPYPIQPWPTLVRGGKVSEIRRATVGLARLLRSVPSRVFRRDPGAIAHFFELASEDQVRLILSEPDGLSGCLFRLDFIDGPEGFRCLEVNASAYIGGWQIRFFRDEILERPAVRELLSRDAGEPSYTDPMLELFEHVVDDTLAAGLAEGEVNVAFLVEAEQQRPEVRSLFRFLGREYEAALARRAPPLRGSLRLVRDEELGHDSGGISHQGTRIHALVEYRNPTLDPRLFRAFKSRRVGLYNSPAAVFLRDKRNLALLSELGASETFDPEERRLIRDHVPWTRIARPGETTFRGETVRLPVFAVEERTSLVLKPALGSRGEGVFVGARTAPKEWARGLDRAFAEGRWILQERVESLPFDYPDAEGAKHPHDVVWGLYAFGNRFGGGFLRMMPKDRGGGVINSATGATEGLLLELPGAVPVPA